MKLEAVRALLTGGAGGLGAGCFHALHAAGASVVACDVDTRGLRQLKLRYGASERAHFLEMDVADEARVQDCVAEAERRLGGINVVINNAGVLRDGLLVDSSSDGVRVLPTAMWNRVLAVNLTGAYLVAREAAARMIGRPAAGGVIVNVSSLARTGNVGQSAYAASKAGLDACTRTWALELGPHGIRVVGIAPGVFKTPMLKHVSMEAQQAMLKRSPLGRFGEVEEFWPLVRLAIESEYLTGRTLEIDGGGSLG